MTILFRELFTIFFDNLHWVQENLDEPLKNFVRTLHGLIKKMHAIAILSCKRHTTIFFKLICAILKKTIIVV